MLSLNDKLFSSIVGHFSFLHILTVHTIYILMRDKDEQLVFSWFVASPDLTACHWGDLMRHGSIWWNIHTMSPPVMSMGMGVLPGFEILLTALDVLSDILPVDIVLYHGL